MTLETLEKMEKRVLKETRDCMVHRDHKDRLVSLESVENQVSQDLLVSLDPGDNLCVSSSHCQGIIHLLSLFRVI